MHFQLPILFRLALIFMVMTCTFSSAFSQDEQAGDNDAGEFVKPWNLGATGMVTYNQVALFNWAAGGNSSMSLIASGTAFANFKRNRSTWDNQLEMVYGFIQNFYSNSFVNQNGAIAKAGDRLEMNSKFGTESSRKNLFYSALLNFRTQFAKGFSSPGDSVYLSDFMAPGYLQLNLGMDCRPTEHWSIMVSPITLKGTFVLDDSLSSDAVRAYGVNQIDENGNQRPGSFKKSRLELGGAVTVKFTKQNFLENVDVESQVDLFTNYLDRPENVDVRWRNNLIANINSWLKVSLMTDLIYDADIDIPTVDGFGNALDENGNKVKESGLPQETGPKIQFKETFGLAIGLSIPYKKNKKPKK